LSSAASRCARSKSGQQQVAAAPGCNECGFKAGGGCGFGGKSLGASIARRIAPSLSSAAAATCLRRSRCGDTLGPNNSFKPKLLRSGNGVAEKACHAVACATQFGLTQVLACR